MFENTNGDLGTILTKSTFASWRSQGVLSEFSGLSLSKIEHPIAKR